MTYVLCSDCNHFAPTARGEWMRLLGYVYQGPPQGIIFWLYWFFKVITSRWCWWIRRNRHCQIFKESQDPHDASATFSTIYGHEGTLYAYRTIILVLLILGSVFFQSLISYDPLNIASLLNMVHTVPSFLHI